MPTIVLRVTTGEIDPDACLSVFSQLKVETVWRKGEPQSRGRVCQTNGINVFLAEDDSSQGAVTCAMTMLAPIGPDLSRLIAGGASLDMDIGLMLAPDALNQSVALDVSTLRSLAEWGVNVVVSAYACSD